MRTGYRLGVLLNVWLMGVLMGVLLYGTIRQASAYEASRSGVRFVPRSAPARGIDTLACGWVEAGKARALGWTE